MNKSKKNIGKLDQLIKLSVAFILIGLNYFNIITGLFATIAYVFSVILLITGITKYCPLYTVFGISTCKN